jgi:hypothetical protein
MTLSALQLPHTQIIPDQEPKRLKENHPFFPVIYQKIGYLWYAIKHKLSGKSNDEMFQEIISDCKKHNDYYMSKPGAKKPSIFDVSTGMLYCDALIKRKLESIFKQKVNAHFTEQMKSGIITRKDLLSFANEKELAKLYPIRLLQGTKDQLIEKILKANQSNSDENFCKQIPFKTLMRKFSNESKIEELFSCLSKNEFKNLKIDLHKVLAFRVKIQQEECLDAFLKLFPSDSVAKDSGWKMCLAQLSAGIDPDQIPLFLHERFSKTYEGLPSDYAQKLDYWKNQQGRIAEYVHGQFKNWSNSSVGSNLAPSDQLAAVLKQNILSENNVEEFVDSQHYCIASKRAETIHSLETGVVEGFMNLQVEMILVHDNWKIYKNRLSEEEFKAAYVEWGKFSLSVSEFEELLEKACAWKVWRKYFFNVPEQQFSKFFKRWYKEKPNQNYEAHCLEVVNAKEVWNKLCSDGPQKQFMSIYLDWLNARPTAPNFEQYLQQHLTNK